jgi:Fe-Mn family superoxide dismutase
MRFELPLLPYARDALAPHLGEETLDFHYDKHHRGYLTKLAQLLEGKPEAQRSLVDVVKGSAGPVFDNAAQVWNHAFYWHSMAPRGGGAPRGELARALDASFGSLENFRTRFRDAGAAQFGSGYAWLVKKPDGRLDVVTTANAQNPLTGADVPLLTSDVWEHAYYLDYRNARPRYLEAFLDHLVHWEFAAANLAGQPTAMAGVCA